MNGDPDTAADITQDVFLKLLENIQSVRKIGKFQNYLLTIAVNTCNNYTKKAKPLYMDLETLEDIEDTDNAFEKIELNELKAQIQYAINTLPDYQKDVIILRFYYDLKIREIYLCNIEYFWDCSLDNYYIVFKCSNEFSCYSAYYFLRHLLLASCV